MSCFLSESASLLWDHKTKSLRNENFKKDKQLWMKVLLDDYYDNACNLEKNQNEPKICRNF